MMMLFFLLPMCVCDQTGMALGDALQENKVLKTLNVANNSIDSVACLTICAGVLENEVRACVEHYTFCLVSTVAVCVCVRIALYKSICTCVQCTYILYSTQ